jgi:hypothetical protein
MTIHECYFERVHSQMSMDTGLSIADVDLIGVSFFGYESGIGICTYSVWFT